jgi:hypothetical protein
VQPDGRIVASGYVESADFETRGAVVRLLSDGQPDPSFSDDGVAVYDEGGGGYGFGRFGFHRIALQTNGRLVAISNTSAVGIRPDGTLDPAFHGDGVVNLLLGEPAVDFARIPYDMTVQDDDKIVIGSTTYRPGEPGMIVMRLLAENTPPALTPAAISVQRGTSPRLTIGTATDASDPLNTLVVAPVAGTLPAGLTFTNFLVNAATGAVSAVATASCTVATGLFDVEFSITDPSNATTFATVPVAVLTSAPRTLSIGDRTGNEGNASAAAAVLVLTANGTVCEPITVNYATADGTAVAPGDYTATSGTATIAAGQTSTTISVPVIGDVLPEQDETFFVQLDAPVNATIADGQGVVTIRDDELSVVQFAGTTTFEVVETDTASPAQIVTLKLVRLNALQSEAHVTFSIGGNATNFSDYNFLDGFASFNAGQSEAEVRIRILPDLIEENTETLIVTMEEWFNASIGSPSTVQITIRDNDGASDADAPVVAGSISVAPNAAGWHKADVSIALSASDGSGSGVKTINYALSGAQTSVLTAVPATNVSIPIVAEGVTVVTFFAEDVEGNVAVSQSLTVRLDKTAPGVVITSPQAREYTLNEAAAAAYGCTDGGSGIASCDGTTSPGAAIDTASSGAKTFTATATDAAGNIASATVAYSVVVPPPTFAIRLLYDPLKEHKSGSAIPIKLQVEDAAGLNVSSPGLVVEAVAVSSGTTIGAAEEEAPDAGQSNPLGRFRFTAEGTYMFNLKTTGLAAGPYVLVVRIAGDATLHAVPFLIR